MSITVSVELQPLLQHFHFITEHYERRLVFLGVIPNGKAGPTGQSRTTSNISHCMSVPGQRKGGGGWEVQYKTIYTATSNARSLGHITETVFQLGRKLN